MLLGKTHYGRPRPYGYGAITLYGPVSNPVRLRHGFITPAGPVGTRKTASHNPIRATPDGYHTRTVWPAPLSLATTHGISFPAGTEMFHFPAYPPARRLVPTHQGRWVPPFGDPRIKARSAAPRGISLPATSFIGPVCQGIHPTPLQATRKTKKQSFKVTATTLREYTRRHIITSEMITKRPKRNTTRVFRIEITTKKTKQKTSFDSRSRPLSSSQTTTTPTAPNHGNPIPRPETTGHRKHRPPKKEDVAVREPKSMPIPLPRTKTARQPTISSTPAPRTPETIPGIGHTTAPEQGPENSVERR